MTAHEAAQTPTTEAVAQRRHAAIQAAGAKLATAYAAIASMTPREQAEAAWTSTSPYASVDELEDVIRVERGLQPLRSSTEDVNRALAHARDIRGGEPLSVSPAPVGAPA